MLAFEGGLGGEQSNANNACFRLPALAYGRRRVLNAPLRAAKN